MVDSAVKNAPGRGVFLLMNWALKDALSTTFRSIKDEWDREYAEFTGTKFRGFCEMFSTTLNKPWFAKKGIKLKPKEINAFDKHTLDKMRSYPDST